MTLINLLILILGAFMSATFTHFLHWCIGSPNDLEAKRGRIFSFYGIWLYDKYSKFEIRTQGKGLNWYKALGMCVYCFGAYVAFVSLGLGFLIGWFKLSSLTTSGKLLEIAALIIVYPSMANFFLRKIK